MHEFFVGLVLIANLVFGIFIITADEDFCFTTFMGIMNIFVAGLLFSDLVS